MSDSCNMKLGTNFKCVGQYVFKSGEPILIIFLKNTHSDYVEKEFERFWNSTLLYTFVSVQNLNIRVSCYPNN